jgi:hypothetical protein
MQYDHADANDPHRTWTISTPLAGITVTALMVVSTASSIPIVGVFNPVTSSVKLVIQRAVYVQTTGTVCNPLWGVMPSAAITATSVTAIRHSTFSAGGHTASVFAGATPVSGTAVMFRPLESTRILGATAAGGDGGPVTEVLNGEMVMRPGTFVGLYSDILTTAGVARASITFTEVPI